MIKILHNQLSCTEIKNTAPTQYAMAITSIHLLLLLVTFHHWTLCSTVPFKEEYVKPGDRKTIYCPLKVTEQELAHSTIRWTKTKGGFIAQENRNGHQKCVDDTKYSIQNRTGLTIRSVNDSDQTSYHCRFLIHSKKAADSHDSVQRSGKVKLWMCSSMIVSENLSKTKNGSGVVIVREFDNFTANIETRMVRPKTTFTWSFNGRTLPEDQHRHECVPAENTFFNCSSTLSFTKTLSSKAGKYKCKVANDCHSGKSISFEIQVQQDITSGSSAANKTLTLLLVPLLMLRLLGKG
ncbi:uncharacterized protein [Ptychodera flava]|uniref:uncharacterized protein isoform X2 n=1 Tax=Ptychodera flava TaxID=63121 RepID=UPI003969E648